MSRPRKYPESVREQAVHMVLFLRQQAGQDRAAISRVAAFFDIPAATLRRWVEQAAAVGTRSVPEPPSAETLPPHAVEEIYQRLDALLVNQERTNTLLAVVLDRLRENRNATIPRQEASPRRTLTPLGDMATARLRTKSRPWWSYTHPS